MLRELSIRELTDIEMDMVSGGEGDEDVVVATGTRRSDWNGYIPPNPYGGNSSNYHESYQPFRSGGGGSTPAPAPSDDSIDSEGRLCSTPGADFGHSWVSYNDFLGGNPRETRYLRAASAMRDMRNEARGCSGIDVTVSPR